MEKTLTFNNRKYYWDGKYYQSTSKNNEGRRERLHRAVWRYYNGEIPKRYHVHHKDGDKANNEINNLELIRIEEHLSKHYKENWKNPEFRKKVKENLDNIRPLTKKWHKSKEGRKWHSEIAKKSYINRRKYTKHCEVCGKEYQTYYPDRARFCHQNCKAKALRARRRL